VPTLDPRLRPALGQAKPADDIPGGPFRADGSLWLILFADGGWHPVTVKAWRRDRQGQDVIDAEWHAELGTWSGTYVADPERMREG
jgi:hypothetical protein